MPLQKPDVCATGGYWCRRCQRYRSMALMVLPPTDAEDDEGIKTALCADCGGQLRWDRPVPGYARGESFMTDPKSFHG